MKINVFRTQAKIGSIIKYKNKKYIISDLDRNNHCLLINNRKWIRCSEVELIKP